MRIAWTIGASAASERGNGSKNVALCGSAVAWRTVAVPSAVSYRGDAVCVCACVRVGCGCLGQAPVRFA
eukprot:4117823-Pleurochrysis_carterae.AAC.1